MGATALPIAALIVIVDPLLSIKVSAIGASNILGTTTVAIALCRMKVEAMPMQ